jgi:hypothetical protein
VGRDRQAGEVNVHPLTLASIRLQPINDFGPVYSCGCELMRHNGKWRLCQYHEGYDDALDASPLPEQEIIDRLSAHIGAYDVEPGSSAADSIASALLDGPLRDPAILSALKARLA